MRLTLFLCASVALAVPAAAQETSDPLAPLDVGSVDQAAQQQTDVKPALPAPPPKVIPKSWPEVLLAIGNSEWEAARLAIEALPNDPLKPYAKAELFTAKGSPKVELGSILAVLSEAPELPQAEQLARMAVARGAIEPPAIIWPRATVALGSAPRRGKTRPVEGEPAADDLRLAIEPLVKVDDGATAETLFLTALPNLSFEARAEAAQRVAWMYFVSGRDADARRVADYGRPSARGDWAAQAAWISGLASWRMNDWNAAYASFREAASLARESEFNAAAYYWTARAAQASRRAKEVAPLLKAAARSQESFYGLMARETLGMDKRLPKSATPRDLDRIEALPNL